MPAWIRGPDVEAAFAAGSIDAEGSSGVYGGRARFKLDSYDQRIVEWLTARVNGIGIRGLCRKVGTEGGARCDGSRFNSDPWRLNVNDALSILRLAATLDPFLRHRDRRTAMDAARANVLERLSFRARRHHDQ